MLAQTLSFFLLFFLLSSISKSNGINMIAILDLVGFGMLRILIGALLSRTSFRIEAMAFMKGEESIPMVN